MTRENDRIDAMVALRDGLERALDDPAADMPINRAQERILRSVAGNIAGKAEARPVGRRCGDCQLCCKLTPVRELNKGANERCQHQRVGKGCMIYPQRPHSCKVWNCRWVLNDDADDLRRPDHAHYVIDVMPDYVTARQQDGSEQHVQVLQIWCDPKFPDAHRDPALRAYLLRRGAEGCAAIIRYSASDAFVLFPPNMATDGRWHEERGQVVDREHSLRDMERALGGRAHMTFREVDE